MSISRKSGATAPENHPFVSGTVPHVLLKHTCQKIPPCAAGYHVATLRRYCELPDNPAWTLIGIYPSEESAEAAARKDGGAS